VFRSTCANRGRAQPARGSLRRRHPEIGHHGACQTIAARGVKREPEGVTAACLAPRYMSCRQSRWLGSVRRVGRSLQHWRATMCTSAPRQASAQAIAGQVTKPAQQADQKSRIGRILRTTG
jgi:hypothetical protein